MRQLFYLFLALLIAGCSTDENTDVPSAQHYSLAIDFSVGDDMQTRTSLNSSESIQHVRQVHLYVFDGTDGAALCIASEEVDWTQDIGGSVSQLYTLGVELEEGKTYKLLAIGLDDESGKTYGLPESILLNTTLSDAKASLQANLNSANIAVSELFVGSAEITITSGYNYSQIELTRRVAGVLAYLKNIPFTVGGKTVTRVQVILHTDQNRSVSLIKNENDEFGNTPLIGSSILMSFDMSAYSKSSKGNFYAFPAITTGAVHKVENSLLGGVYLLPIAGSQDQTKHTLRVQLLDASSNILSTYPIVSRASSEPLNNYSLKSNHFYGLGVKKLSNSTEDDLPLDLLKEQVLEIRVNPNWENAYDIGLVK